MPDKITIVLDPGHGGENEGLKHEGHIEKYMNRTVAQSMKTVLEQYDNVEVYITNEDCIDMSLKQRAQYAKEVGADILISLHFNMSEDHTNFGSEVWIPSKGTPSAKMRSLGDLFLDEFQAIGLHTRGVKTRLNDEGTDYYGIIRESEALGIPAILVEHCYADYKTDSPYIQTEEGIARFGQIDAEAVAKYYGLTSVSLGKDYREYVKNGYFAPESPVGSDTTGPANAKIYLIEQEKGQVEVVGENKEGTTLSFLLTAVEEESKITYYSYSLDGGKTYTEMFPWTGNQNSMIISIPNVYQGSRLVAKIYNGHTIGSETNVLAFGDPIVETPEPLKSGMQEEAVEETQTGIGASLYQWFISDSFVLHMWVAGAVLLAISFIIAATLWVRKKRDKIKKLFVLYGSICLVFIAGMFSIRGSFVSGPSAQMTYMERENRTETAMAEIKDTDNSAKKQEKVMSLSGFIEKTDKTSLTEAQVLQEQKETMEVVYDIAEGYLRVKSIPDVKRNTYNFNYIADENNFKTYADTNGVKSRLGIDVSKFQGSIDFQAVKESGVSFVMIRLGIRGYETGALVVDERFEENFAKAKAAGLDVGVYFFSGAMNVEEAKEEAQFVTKVLAGRTLEMPVVFDSELITYADARTNNLLPSQVTAHAIAFCDQTAQDGYQPMIYANAKRLTTVYYLEQLQNYPIWYADYQEKPIYPYAYDMWQYTEKGKVPGITGNVDINLYFVNE